MPVKDLYYQKYLKYKNKYLNLQSQMGGGVRYTGVDIIKKFYDAQFAKLFTKQTKDVQDEIYKKMDEIPITRTLHTTRRDSVDIKTFTSLKEKLRLDKSIEKEAMFISVPIIVYHPDYLNNNEILMLAKIFIQNSNNPNMTPLINYMTLSPDSIQLVNASNLPLKFDLTQLKEFIFNTMVNQQVELIFNKKNYLNDNQLHFELFFIFICILLTNKQIKLKFTSINLNVYKKSFNTIMFGLKQNIITYLKINNCRFSDEEAKLLANALKNNTTLLEFYIDRNQIGAEGAKALANALGKNTTLLDFSLGNNQIGDEGAKALAIALEKNTTLMRLELYNNNIGIDGTTALASALEKNETLYIIYLCDNNIGDDGAIALASALKKTTISSINISNIKIGDKGAKALATALEKNTTLLNLNLKNNQIGDEGAKALATALEKNRSLETLYLYENNIGKEGIDALTSVLEKNKILQPIEFF